MTKVLKDISTNGTKYFTDLSENDLSVKNLNVDGDVNITGGAGLTVNGTIDATGSIVSTISRDISNTNLNNLVGTGFFKGHTLTNSPNDGATNWWYIQQIIHSQTEWVVQKAFPLSGGRLIDTVWIRTRRGSTWGSWVSQRPNQKISLSINASPLTLTTTAWTPLTIPFDITYGATVGDRLTRQGNAVRIGSGIRRVEVNATFSWYGLGTAYDLTINIYVNGSWRAVVSYDNSNDTYCTRTGQPVRLDVVEGDLITAVVTRGLTGTFQIFGNVCRLNVEAIE